MKKGMTMRQTMDVIFKILIAFVIVFFLYFTSKLTDSFVYNYFLFPFFSIIVVFMCGVNVGKALEKMKNNKSTGFFSKSIENDKKETPTEFKINNRNQIITTKKIVKESDDFEKVHIKVFDYDDVKKR